MIENNKLLEMTLFTKNKENWTRFKIGLKQIYTIPPTVLLALGEPTKKTTRFYFFETFIAYFIPIYFYSIIVFFAAYATTFFVFVQFYFIAFLVYSYFRIYFHTKFISNFFW